MACQKGTGARKIGGPLFSVPSFFFQNKIISLSIDFLNLYFHPKIIVIFKKIFISIGFRNLRFCPKMIMMSKKKYSLPIEYISTFVLRIADRGGYCHNATLRKIICLGGPLFEFFFGGGGVSRSVRIVLKLSLTTFGPISTDIRD